MLDNPSSSSESKMSQDEEASSESQMMPLEKEANSEPEMSQDEEASSESEMMPQDEEASALVGTKLCAPIYMTHFIFYLVYVELFKVNFNLGLHLCLIIGAEWLRFPCSGGFV